MILTVFALIQAELPPSPPVPSRIPPVTDVWAWDPAKAIRDGSANCLDCQTRTERFMVVWEVHGGFSLRALNPPDEFVSIVFAKPRLADRFSDFLNRPGLIGTRLYCDCMGQRYALPGGGVIFRVGRANLFTRRD